MTADNDIVERLRHTASMHGWTVVPPDSSAAMLLEAAAEIVRLRGEVEREERSHGLTIDQRDRACEMIDSVYMAVMDASPEWSSVYGFADALSDIEDRIHAIRSATIAPAEAKDPAPAMPNGVEARRHAANEWADMAINGVQWLRNIRAGISTADEALAEMESNLLRVRALNDEAQHMQLRAADNRDATGVPAWIEVWMADREILPDDDGDGISEGALVEALNNHERELLSAIPKAPAAVPAGEAVAIYQLADGEGGRLWQDADKATFDWWQGRGRPTRIVYTTPPAPVQAAPPAAQVQQEAAPTLPVVIFGETYDVPIRVQLHIEHLRMKLDAIGNTKGTHPVQRLLDATEHCLSAADEGVEYGVGRPMLDAMTTLGLMEKVGRGKWAPTDAAEQFVTHARATHPAAGDKVRELVDRLVKYRTDEGTPLGDFFFANVSSDYLRPYMEAALAQPQEVGRG